MPRWGMEPGCRARRLILSDLARFVRGIFPWRQSELRFRYHTSRCALLVPAALLAKFRGAQLIPARRLNNINIHIDYINIDIDFIKIICIIISILFLCEVFVDGQQQVKQAPKWMPLFLAVWGGQAVSLLGSQLVQFALVWWLTQKTGSATVLATATLAAMLPQILLGPLAGTLVDRWNRRLVMIGADALTALATVVLALLFWSGRIEIWHIYALMFFRSAMGGFQWPAMQASISLMVPKQHLSRVQGLNQMLQGMMNIGAAPLGALLLGLLPMQGVLAVDVVTALLAIVPLVLVKIPQPERSLENAAGAPASTVWDEMWSGFRYAWSWPALMMIAAMATIINLVLVPTNALQPILVTDHFGGQAFHLAWLESAWGIGVVAGGLTLGVWGGFKRRVATSLAGLVVLGLSVIGVGSLPSNMFGLAVALWFVAGFSNPFVNGPLFAVLQAVVAPEMQGRVFNLISSMAVAMSPLGLILAGPIADHFGVRTWFVVGGMITMLLGMGAFLSRTIMNIESEGDRLATTVKAEVAGD